MNLAKLALENSRITVCAILLIVLAGTAIYSSYPSSEDPTIQIRSASVTASFPGMSPDRVEELITKPIESAMREIAEIKDIISTSKTGSVKVKLQLYDHVTDLASVFQKIRNKANDIQSSLPEGTSGPFVHDEEGLTAIATIALWADGFSMSEMRDVAHDARDLLYTLDGIRKVEIMGAQEERIYLEIAPSRLAQLGVSVQDVFGALAQQNIIKPGGAINVDGRIVLLEPSGNITSVEAIRNVVFKIPDTDQVLRLGEILTVRRELIDPPTAPVFFNDKPAIILSVSTIEGTNNVEFGSQLTTLLDEIQQDLPIGYVLDYATFQPKLIAAAVDSAVSNVYQTLAIVLVVVIMFLGVRTGLIVGFFVPLTMLLGIIVMSLVGVELQRMSIAATIISLGMLVDNGIVVAEDIRVRLEKGAARWDAAIESGRTLALPLLTSSLTTIFAFMPMMFIAGGAGEYVRSLAQVVTILLLGSWFLSMTVTPAMCAWFMRAPEGPAPKDNQPSEAYDGIVYTLYRQVLRVILKWRLTSIAGLIVMLIMSVQLLGTIKNEFFPLGDRSQFLVYLDFEAGTDIRETQTQLRILTGWLADKSTNPEISSHVAYVGSGGPRFFLSLSPVDRDAQRAFVLINTKTFDDVSPVLNRVNDFLDANLPGAQADAKRMWFGGTEPGVLKIRLIGPDGNVLADHAERLISALHKVPGAAGIKQDWENKILKLVVDVDQVRARRAGVTSSDVADSLNTVYAGKAISDYREGDKSIPIVVRGDDTMRNSLSSLQRIQIYSSTQNTFVSLAQVATIRAEWRFSRVKRRNQQRTLTVEARNNDISTARFLDALAPALNALDLPTGYRFEIAGEIKDQKEANGKLFGFLPMAIAAIAILLIGQFNSLRKGAIIVATVPLILIGGTLGLLVMNAANGFMVLLGFFSLAGILINNAIVLVDRIETEEKAGRDPLDAVIEACLARLRPILLTTLTTVLGLVPLILFGGALFYGMASVIAFGLVVATLITLGFVPALYTLMFKIPTRDALNK